MSHEQPGAGKMSPEQKRKHELNRAKEGAQDADYTMGTGGKSESTALAIRNEQQTKVDNTNRKAVLKDLNGNPDDESKKEEKKEESEDAPAQGHDEKVKNEKGEEKKAGLAKTMAKNFAVGGGMAAGAVAGGFFAGIWGLFKLYKDALFDDILPKGGGGGGKKSGGGGHGGGGHSKGGGGGHH